MKRIYLLIMLLFGCVSAALAQNCYEDTRSRGIAQYNKGEYRIAKDQFTAARDCPDKPANNDLDAWISKCNTAIANANRQSEEERKRREAQQAALQAIRFQAAAKAYMNITQVDFANTDEDSNILQDFGTTLTASEVKYLTPRIHYDGLATEAKKVTLYVKLYNPDGSLRTGTDSPSGYTYSTELTVSPGNGKTYSLPGWGNASGGTYTGGTHRFEIWYNGKQLYQKSVTLQGSGVAQSIVSNSLSRREWAEALRKTVNYVTEKYDNGSYKGEKANGRRSGLGVYAWNDETYYWGRWANGDENGMAIYILPEGYQAANCPDCSFFVGHYSSDDKSGKGTCYDEFGTLIYYGNFENDKPTEAYPTTGDYSAYRFECIKYNSGDMYLGETKDGLREGYGIYIWKSGDAWYGPWTDDKRDGYGIHLYYNGAFKTDTWRENTK